MPHAQDAIVESLLKLHNIVPDQHLLEALASSKRQGEPASQHLRTWLDHQLDVDHQTRQHLQDPLHIIPGYTLQEKIGEGQWGIVYRASQDNVRRFVAIKILYPELAHTPAAARFWREIEVLGKLNHPNIVHALDAGNVGPLRYLVMEFFDGSTLAQYVRARGPLPEREVLGLAQKLASALEHMWSKGLVHRNVVPENIMVARGEVKLADLGLAREVIRGSNLTSYVIPARAFAYLAPEQLRGDSDIDYRCDVYAFAAVLYYALTGNPPAANLPAVAGQRKPSIILGKQEGVHEDTADLIMRMLSADKNNRCQSFTEIANAFALLGQNHKTARLSFGRPQAFYFSSKYLVWLAVVVVIACACLVRLAPEIQRRLATSEQRLQRLTPQALYANCAPAVVLIETRGSTGCGVLLQQENMRLILSNQHLVKEAALVNVTLKDGRTFTASVLASDTRSDLSVLALPDEIDQVATLVLADMRDIAVGNDVFVIGHPKGYRWSLTRGTVSGLRATTIQTDAAIYPGNSGGPLLDSRGRVAGVVTFLVGSTNPIGFAVSAAHIHEFLGTLIPNHANRLRWPKKEN